MDFASRLKDLRTKKNLSQAELAKRLDVSKSRISMYELGEREPDFETLEKIADFFNVDMDYLLGKKEVSTYVISPEQKAVADMIIEDRDMMLLLIKMQSEDYRKKVKRWIALMEAYEREEEER